MKTGWSKKSWSLLCQICLGLILTSCSPLSVLTPKTALPKPLTLLPVGTRILWIGDSLTLQLGFRSQVEAYFSQHHSQKKLLFEKMAKRGATVGWALDMVEKRTLKSDVVLILLGTNDSGNLGVQRSKLRSYRFNMARLVDTIVATGAKPILITPPCVAPRSYSLRQKNRMLYQMTIELLQLGQKRSVSVIDLHSMFCQLLKDASSVDQLFADDKHPSPLGHMHIAALLIRILSSTSPVRLQTLIRNRHQPVAAKSRSGIASQTSQVISRLTSIL